MRTLLERAAAGLLAAAADPTKHDRLLRLTDELLADSEVRLPPPGEWEVADDIEGGE